MSLITYAMNVQKLNQRITERDIYDFMHAIMTIIKYCHDNNIIHRDIKPDNIMFGFRNGDFSDIILIDFGHSRILRKDQISSSRGIGTPHFSSPELLLQQFDPKVSHNFKTDIWSIGVTVVTL